MQPVDTDMEQKPLPRLTGFKMHLKVCSFFELEGADHYENTGKIILPQVVLQELMEKEIFMSPQCFRLSHPNYREIYVYAIAQEYIGLPGRVYMPTWMMETLGVSFDDFVVLESSCPLAPGTFTKVQATSPAFLEIPNHKETLELVLSEFGCLTESSTIRFTYDGRVYELRILKTLPSTAVSLIDTSIAIDFERPLGYVTPPKRRQRTWTVVEDKKEPTSPFAGTPRCVTGTPKVRAPERPKEPEPTKEKPKEKVMAIPFSGRAYKL